MPDMQVNIYRRRNGDWGCSVGDLQDAGYDISATPDELYFTVSNHDGKTLCRDALRIDAAHLILKDWKGRA